MQVLSLPCCVSKTVKNWNHSLPLGPSIRIRNSPCSHTIVQIYLIDSNAYVSSNPTIYDYIREDQIQWYLAHPTTGELGIAFFHIPIPEYKVATIRIGQKGEEPCSPEHNSGFFEAVTKKGDIHAMFVGHDHWNDYVGYLFKIYEVLISDREVEDVWLAFGRVSGHTAPSYYGFEVNGPKCPARGCRVIEYNSHNKQLSTWVETLAGTVHDSFISKTINK
jgi:hypothetical protein